MEFITTIKQENTFINPGPILIIGAESGIEESIQASFEQGFIPLYFLPANRLEAEFREKLEQQVPYFEGIIPTIFYTKLFTA